MERKDYEKRFRALREEATTWTPAWQDIQKFVAPHRGSFNSLPNQGDKIDHRALLDSTATRALNILASGMTSGMTSPSRPWMKLSIPDEDMAKYQPVQYWLEDTSSRMLSLFARAKIYNNLTSVYEEVGSFSVGAMMLMEDFESVFRGRHFTCGEYFLGHDFAGRLNSFGREMYIQAEALVETFGERRVSDAVNDACKNNNGLKWVKVCHLIMPNSNYTPGAADSKHMRFVSVYWEEGAKDGRMLRESGYRTFPVMAPRWSTSRTSDTYSKSAPGWQLMGDVKMLQKLWKNYHRAQELVNHPPMVKDSNISGNVSQIPGGVTTASLNGTNPGVRTAYQINPDLPGMLATINDVRQRIQEGYFTNLFLMLYQGGDTQKTAREVVERHEEKLLILGPLLESLEDELHDPLIDRAFDIGMSSGAFLPPPPELQGMELKVEYISPLAQAQKMIGVTSIEQGARFVGSVIGVVPEVADVINWDEMTRQHLVMDGVSAKILNSEEQVAAIRKQRADAAAQQQAAQNAILMAQGAKVLSETKMGENNALDQTLAAVGGDAK